MPGTETPAVSDENIEAAEDTAPETAPVDEEESDGAEVTAEPEAEVIEIVPELSPEEKRARDAIAARDAERGRREDAEGRLRAISKAYKDLQAEMDEFKKRMEARSRIQVQNKAAEILRAFFEPIQNLGRAAEAGGDVETLHAGVQMVLKQFQDTMNGLGLAEIPGVGAPFNPELHEALALTPVTDADQDGIVLMVHRTGYQLAGQVIQPSQVVIGKHEAPVAEA